MGITLLSLLLLMPELSRSQEIRPVCVSANCNDGASAPGAETWQYGTPSIAWGGMTKRAHEAVMECGRDAICKVLRSPIYPLFFIFDAPVFAVKGVGYGLYYGALGVGYVGKKIGQGIAYPFRPRPIGPIEPPKSWEAYKRQVLRYQKRLARLDPSNKENAKWCKGHIPLSHGPSRAAWEARCNPDNAVPRTALPADVRDSAVATAPSEPPANAQGSQAAVASASPPAETSAAPQNPSTRAPEAPAAAVETTSSQAGAAETADAAPAPATSAPPQSGDVASSPPQALPPATTPVLRDPDQALKGGQESLKEASQGGFDDPDPMLGKPGSAPSSIAAPMPGGRIGSEAPSPAASLTTIPDTGPGAATASRDRRDPPPARTKVHPEVATGDAVLIGDPDRFRNVFARQTGETCAIVAARQMLSAHGVLLSEDALFFMAFAKGYFVATNLCPDPGPEDFCEIRYDAATGLCRLHSAGAAGRLPDARTCEVARRLGATRFDGVGRLMEDASGKAFVNRYIPYPAKSGAPDPAAYHRELMRRELPSARADLLAALRAGKAVTVTMEKRAFWRADVPRGLHAVVVTAAVERRDGAIAGYFVNDSGTGTHARFVPHEEFESAWLQDNLQRVYPQ